MSGDRLDLLERINQLEKVFDKACEMLSKNATDSDGYSYEKEQWKEWCMRDE